MSRLRPIFLEPPSRPTAKRTAGSRLLGWALGSFAVTLIMAAALSRLGSCSCERQDLVGPPRPAQAPGGPGQAPPSPLDSLVFPTTVDLLTPTNAAAVFMPTASGNLESAFFGSARTGTDGRARFHAGVDIAPARRDRRGRPLDEVKAVADGTVAYVNRVGGDSSYGIYVVLLHDDPVGPVYSLYAHLASVATSLKAGVPVKAATVLGVMGYSANTGIPVARAHLHVELGVLLSDRFGTWARANKLVPDRGNFHGWNLFAVDPLDVYTRQRASHCFSMKDYLAGLPAAFELVLSPARLPSYFQRYPSLWKGPKTHQGPLVLRVSEGGVILSGRPASESEASSYAAVRKPIVQAVDETVLGRNGMHLVARINNRWTLGRAAERWLTLLTY